MEKSEHQIRLEKRNELGGNKPIEATIIRCSGFPDCQWYKDLVGQTITVNYYGSFGVFNMTNQWLYYYDLRIN